MNKAIYFDMDGSIADLYGVEGWLEGLRAHDPSPYVEAEPMWDMGELESIVSELKSNGYIIGVITWLSKESTKEYDRAVRTAKRLWLEAHGLWKHLDEVHMVKYGTPKHHIAKVRNSILVDDNEDVRKSWEKGGSTIDPTNTNLLEALMGLIEKEDN